VNLTFCSFFFGVALRMPQRVRLRGKVSKKNGEEQTHGSADHRGAETVGLWAKGRRRSARTGSV